MIETKTHLPAARIVADGVDITTQLIDRDAPDSKERSLASITVTDEAGIRSDSVEIVVDYRGRPNVPAVGSELKVWLGYEPAPVYMGRFRVDEITISGPPNVITVSAKSAELTTVIRRKKMRSWHDTTIGAIVTKIAGEHGLGTAIDQEIAARLIEHIDQQTESDMGFLSRLAKRNGATFKLADGKVIFAKKGSMTHPSGGEKDTVIITPRDVSTWSVTQSERGGHRSAVCYYHDHDLGKRIGVLVGAGEPRHVDGRLYGTKAEAEAAAAAQLGDLTRGKREAQIDGPGNPAIFAEGRVRLEGFDPDCDGGFFAKSVVHSFSGSGFTTSVSLETEKSDPEGG